MNSGQQPPGTMNITGGTFIGSAVGYDNKASHNTVTVGGVQAQASLDDLRAVLAAVRNELVGAATSPDMQSDVRYEVRKMEEELAKEKPDGSVVRSRWEQVGAMLGPLAAASGSITQITDLITKIFGGS